jgi:hypothetical protein
MSEIIRNVQKKSQIRVKTSIHAYILKILEDEDRPMKVGELMKEVLKKRDITSKNQVSTVSAVLQRSRHVKKAGKGSYILKK